MDSIKIEVIGNIAKVTDKPAVITSGTVGLMAEFTFDSQWEGLTKTAVFRACGVMKSVDDIGTEVTVPWEVLKKHGVWLTVGVTGINRDGTIVIPTLWANVCVIKPGATTEGDPGADPTLPVWQQIKNDVENLCSVYLLADGESVEDAPLDAGVVIDPNGEPLSYEDFSPEQLEAVRGPQGPQGDSGAAGPQGIPGNSGVYIGTGAPPDTANVWINPEGEPTGTEDWEFDMPNGTTDTKTVVVIGADKYNGQLAFLKLKQDDGTWVEIPAIVGSKGDPGPQGPQGDRGLQGIQGERGLQGIQGERGVQGIQGIPGDSGVHIGTDAPPSTANIWINPNGAPTGTEEWEFDLPDGITDTKTVVVIGADEANGQLALLKMRKADGTWVEIPAIVGSKGDKGDKGEKGDKGDKGDKGETGATGATGATGPQGEPFEYEDFTPEQLEALRGPQGIQGEQGPRGYKGDAFTYLDFTPEQLSALRGPQGLVGPQGQQGIPGVQGQPGVQGEVGPAGPQGVQGVQGETGAQGIQGEAGPQGERGIQGIQGEKGEQGIQGEQGPQGIQGPEGPQGPQGIPGVAVQTAGYVTFNVTEDGILQCTYTGDEPPNYTINDDGHLILTI